ncbi:Dihydroneopterin triphosphate diphosphatase [Listeria monocytogenes]|uniref:NUDIX hydrolase n=1 Tax=Listeria monocytogenes TaxID=1639 RepID=UPI000E76E77B|nr:NUDIX pyrophosphatase [Listeria monocytogenes]RKA27968.1 Dihydroneopterin triphosphate diphosphatase [Listeria monocytogenes]
MRQPFQVLVIPYIYLEDTYQFGIFLRNDMKVWQFIAGGGEDNETPMETAVRESKEELNLRENLKVYALESQSYIPSMHFSYAEEAYENGLYVVPEFTFGCNLSEVYEKINLSDEHDQYKWVSYDEAMHLLEWDSNKTAIYELMQKINNNNLY